ncbi:MAG: hypothetical protein KDK26_12485 [Roseivivax sp.]|nr:hypothetical protein [Roseivivax sp.]
MSWFDRRTVLFGGAVLTALSACGFTPAYAPDGAAQRLLGTIALAEPASRAEYLLAQRLEERLGRAAVPVWRLSTKLSINDQGLGTSTDGRTTRMQLRGSVALTLTGADGATVLTDTIEGFVGYSTTGSTVATLAAARDAEERLMVILADQIVDRLVLAAADLPQ